MQYMIFMWCSFRVLDWECCFHCLFQKRWLAMNKEELDPESLPPIDVEAEVDKLPDEFGEMNGIFI